MDFIKIALIGMMSISAHAGISEIAQGIQGGESSNLRKGDCFLSVQCVYKGVVDTREGLDLLPNTPENAKSCKNNHICSQDEIKSAYVKLADNPAFTLKLSEQCRKTVEQSKIATNKIEDETRTYEAEQNNLIGKGSLLYAKQQGCPEQYYQFQIDLDRGNITDQQNEIAKLQTEHDKWANMPRALAWPKFIAYFAGQEKQALHLLGQGMGPGPLAPVTLGEYIDSLQNHIDQNKATIAYFTAEIEKLKAASAKAVATPIADMDQQRAQASAAYAKEEPILEDLLQKQLSFVKSDKSCTQDELDQINQAEVIWRSDIGKNQSRFLNLDGSDLQEALVEVQNFKTLSVDQWAKAIYDYGCDGKSTHHL